MDKENYAKVHSIETFGTVDGPGIRYVVFLQGCHLQCKYCQNRDTWDINSGKYISVEELVNNIKKYITYITPRGGVTISGGEPLLQPYFLITLFKELKKLGIKHIDTKKCKNLVGFSNEKELTFAKYLSDNNIPIWIRQVLVPGYTDDEKDLLKLKDFLSSLKTVQKIELLPYHNLGKHKWEALNKAYPLENIQPATQDDVERAKKILGI